jgi:hypothetical protein
MTPTDRPAPVAESRRLALAATVLWWASVPSVVGLLLAERASHDMGRNQRVEG